MVCGRPMVPMRTHVGALLTPVPCVAVVGAGGASGASTLVAALAVVAARAGWTSVAIDGDPWGGGLDALLDVSTQDGVRWPQLLGGQGALPGAELIARLPVQENGARVLACDSPELIPAERLHEVIAACRLAADLVVVDLPRDLSGAAAVALGQATDLIVVTSPERRVLQTTEHLVGLVHAMEPGLPIGLVLRDTREQVARQVARLSDLPLLGVLADDRKVDQRHSAPMVPGSDARSPVSQLAATILRDLLVERRVAS